MCIEPLAGWARMSYLPILNCLRCWGEGAMSPLGILGGERGNQHYKLRQDIEKDAVPGVETPALGGDSAGHQPRVAARGADLRQLLRARAAQRQVVDQQPGLA